MAGSSAGASGPIGWLARFAWRTYTWIVTEAAISRAVAERVPTLLDEPIKVLRRRDPVRVTPGTSLAACLIAIQGTGTGDSVVVADPDGRLRGVLTERQAAPGIAVVGMKPDRIALGLGPRRLVQDPVQLDRLPGRRTGPDHVLPRDLTDQPDPVMHPTCLRDGGQPRLLHVCDGVPTTGHDQ